MLTEFVCEKRERKKIYFMFDHHYNEVTKKKWHDFV